MRIALCVIATNNYRDFIKPLIESADNYFLIGHDVHYYRFSDIVYSSFYSKERPIYCNYVKHQPWPMMTLKRYHIMSAVDFSGYDYVYYIDADMLFVAPVGEEIFGDLVGVLHPGYYNRGGDWCINPRSEAYVPVSLRKQYICGGFQGGRSYANYFKYLSAFIDDDEQKGSRAAWNDESHWNALYAYSPDLFTILTPSYCMVEEMHKRELWGLSHFEPKIIALAKEHSKYQK